MQIGDLLKGQPLVLLQDDGAALLLRELRHGALHVRAQVLQGNDVLDGLARIRFRRHLDDVDAFGRLDHWGAALFPQPVAAQVERDAVQPGRELGLAAETADRAERPEEGFLRDIACIFVPPQRPVRQGVDRALPALDELVEAIGIAIDRPGDEVLVRGHGRHML